MYFEQLSRFQLLVIEMFCFFLLLFIEEFHIRFEERSLIPTEEESLRDDISDMCARFQRRNTITIPQYTQFRVQKFAGHISDMNVTITGSRLGCGYNLYIYIALNCGTV